MRPLMWSHSIDRMKILRSSQNWRQNITRTALETNSNVKWKKKQGYIWNQKHLKRLWKLWRLLIKYIWIKKINEKSFSYMIMRNQHHRFKVWTCIYPLKLTLSAMKILPRSCSFNFVKIWTFSQQWREHLAKTASGRAWIVELEKNQRQIWNQRPLKRWRLLWRLLLRFLCC